MEKLKKILNREVVFYIIFGILTTIVNIVVSYILKAFFNVETNIASTIGIIACVIFAYFTNRKWVFNSQANTMKEKWLEFFKFILGRAFTMVVEIIGVFLLNDVLHAFYNFGDNTGFLIDKCIVTVIVIILNFFISKFFAFKK